jgi:hypothetical protein
MAMSNPEQQFVEAARQHGVFTEHDPAATGPAYDRVVAARDALRLLPDKGQAFLLSCLADKDPSVVSWAAFYLLPLRETEAVKALERVANGGTRLIAFNAEITLDEWRAGRLTVD